MVAAYKMLIFYFKCYFTLIYVSLEQKKFAKKRIETNFMGPKMLLFSMMKHLPIEPNWRRFHHFHSFRYLHNIRKYSILITSTLFFSSD